MTDPAPPHITLRGYRITPAHLERWQDHLRELGIRQRKTIEEFEQQGTRLMEGIYTRGFEDGFAAAILATETKDPNGT